MSENVALASALSQRARPLDTRAFVALSAAAGLGSIQFWMTVPLAALTLAERGVPAWKIGVIGAIPWLVLVILVPLVPKFAARLGAMRTFRAGCWLGVAGAVAFASGNALVLWMVGYALCGAGIALRWIVSDALIATLAPPHLRGRWVGLFESWIGGTMALGPLLLTVADPTTSLPFLIGVGIAATALPPALLARIPQAETTAPRRRATSVAALLSAARKSPLALVAAAACGIIEGASGKLLPVQSYGLGFGEAFAAATVAVFGAGNVLTQYPIGQLAHRLPDRRLIIGALLTIAAIAALVPLATAHPPLFMAALAAVGGMTGGLYTLAVIRAGHAGSPLEAMGIIAGISLAYTMGSTAGPMLAGAATELSLSWGLPLTIATTALSAATLAILAPIGSRKDRN